MGRVAVIAIVAVVASVALSGCFDPYRARVPEAVLEESPMDWNVTVGAQNGKSLGTKTVETRYVHLPDATPPFPGAMQVFSVRGIDKTAAALLSFTEKVVDEAIEREGIKVDPSQSASGERLWANGVTSDWFMRGGTIANAAPDSLFLPGGEQDILVHILGEVGYDGKTKTAIVTVAFVQVGDRTASTIPGLPPTERLDDRTWNEIVGDPAGTIDNAALPAGRGLIYNLRTHG